MFLWARKTLFSCTCWVIDKLHRLFFLLRLYTLVLQRDAARSGASADSDQERINSGSSWLEFCQAMSSLAEFVVGPQPTARSVVLTALDRREGFRYLTRVMRGGLEAFMDTWDPAYPVLRPLPYNVKLGADNPDNLYMYATVSGAYSYRITGRRGTVTYLSIAVYCGSRPGQGRHSPSIINTSQLVVQPDGSFEIYISPDPRGDNWLQLHDDASRIVVRQTFLDRSREQPAALALERLHVWDNAEATRPPRPPLQANQVVAGLSGAAVFISGTIYQFQKWSCQFAAQPNSLHALDDDVYMSAWADPSIFFLHGYWSCGRDEALVIPFKPPSCVYWNFQLDNWWMESLDWENHPHVTANKASAHTYPGGQVVLVVAHADPRPLLEEQQQAKQLPGAKGVSEGSAAGGGVAAARHAACVTWVDTAHHLHGTMGVRWVLSEGGHHPVPAVLRVKLDRLCEALEGLELLRC